MKGKNMAKIVKELDEKSFEKFIAQSKPAMVDFWADWCGPCKALAPFVEQVAEEFAGKAYFGKVNIDDHPELADKFEVSSIPTLIVFKGGQILERSMGMRPKAGLAQMISKHI